MNAMQISLITPTYRGDLERCEVLCDSIDRFVGGYGRHRLIVHDEDISLFHHLVSNKRSIEPVSLHLPFWLRPLPFGLHVRKRKFWFSPRGLPLRGWHIQQIVKISATAQAAEEVSIVVDSDIAFARPFDVWNVVHDEKVDLPEIGTITYELPNHVQWLNSTQRLLGLEPVAFPAPSYIAPVVPWRRDVTQSLIRRIESVTGKSWIAALCDERNFSEYLLYGNYVRNTPSAMALHTWRTKPYCLTHWDNKPIGMTEVLALINGLDKDQYGICVQSFSSTPIAIIRNAIAQSQKARV